MGGAFISGPAFALDMISHTHEPQHVAQFAAFGTSSLEGATRNPLKQHLTLGKLQAPNLVVDQPMSDAMKECLKKVLPKLHSFCVVWTLPITTPSLWVTIQVGHSLATNPQPTDPSLTETEDHARSDATKATCEELVSTEGEGPLAGVQAMGKQAVEKSKEWGPGKTAAVLVGGGIAMVAIAGNSEFQCTPYRRHRSLVPNLGEWQHLVTHAPRALAASGGQQWLTLPRFSVRSRGSGRRCGSLGNARHGGRRDGRAGCSWPRHGWRRAPRRANPPQVAEGAAAGQSAAAAGAAAVTTTTTTAATTTAAVTAASTTLDTATAVSGAVAAASAAEVAANVAATTEVAANVASGVAAGARNSRAPRGR
eukprot:1196129-Prorocentrum_minimum.AAC.8